MRQWKNSCELTSYQCDTSETTAWYVLCAFKAFSNSWKSLYMYGTSSHHQAVHFWKQDSPSCHRISLDISERLVLLGFSFLRGFYIVSSVSWYCDEIHFSICILTLTITRLRHFCWPKGSGLWHQTPPTRHQNLSPWGWGLSTRLVPPVSSVSGAMIGGTIVTKLPVIMWPWQNPLWLCEAKPHWCHSHIYHIWDSDSGHSFRYFTYLEWPRLVFRQL